MKNFDIIILASFLIFLGLLGFEINSLTYDMPPHGFVSEEGDSYEKQVKAMLGIEHKPSPRKQIQEGIDPHDVICSESFVLLLKWTENSSACVTKQTANKLVQLGWGSPRENTVIPSVDSGCITPFDFRYEFDKPDKRRITKIIREGLWEIDISENYGPYQYRWDYVFVEESQENNLISVSFLGIIKKGSPEYQKIMDVLDDFGFTLTQEKDAWCYG